MNRAADPANGAEKDPGWSVSPSRGHPRQARGYMRGRDSALGKKATGSGCLLFPSARLCCASAGGRSLTESHFYLTDIATSFSGTSVRNPGQAHAAQHRPNSHQPRGQPSTLSRALCPAASQGGGEAPDPTLATDIAASVADIVTISSRLASTWSMMASTASRAGTTMRQAASPALLQSRRRSGIAARRATSSPSRRSTRRTAPCMRRAP